MEPLVEAFCGYLQRQRRASRHTVRAYGADVRALVTFCSVQLGRLGDRAQEVASGQHADQRIVIDHGQAAHAILEHPLGRGRVAKSGGLLIASPTESLPAARLPSAACLASRSRSVSTPTTRPLRRTGRCRGPCHRRICAASLRSPPLARS